MRLDHLLSKEYLFSLFVPAVWWVRGLLPVSVWVVVWGLFVEWLGARCWVVRERPRVWWFPWCGRVAAGLLVWLVVRCCLFVENFIVDASIFVVSFDCLVRARWLGWLA